MWNAQRSDVHESMLAETVRISGYDQTQIHAYYARPTGPGPYPGVVVLSHMPGWDELNREVTRRFAQHGFLALCPNIYERFGHGLPEEVSARARQAGGVPDGSVMGDAAGCLDYLIAEPTSNSKVGVIGMCSGGRHAFMAACEVDGFDAAVDCWGGGVTEVRELSPGRVGAAIDLTPQLSCPLLGIFGNDDTAPSPGEVDLHEAALKDHGKDYIFHRYDNAGHAIWNYTRDAYRPAQAMDSWNKVLAFFAEHLAGET